MAETINNKPSIQIRSGLPSPLPDKSPSPAAKLLISHGKPNFTIARSPKIDENGNGNPLSVQATANNNYNAYKTANSSVANSQKFIVGTKFNGVFKPSNAAATWATNGNGIGNGNGTSSEAENEAAKVVLRRPKLESSPPPAEKEDENVPEFIRRQRRIQERLAKENVLDFESRRSGYFTHVMISPDSPNRTSFVETMASPAIVPALEIPAPVAEKVEEVEKEEAEAVEAQPRAIMCQGPIEETITTVYSEVEPEEVAQAIEQVNQAVAGEEEADVEPVPVQAEIQAEPVLEVSTPVPAPVEAKVEVVEPAAPVQNGQEEEAAPVSNGLKEEVEAVASATNGHKEEKEEEEAITISHTNGHSSDGPSIPTPDPSGALGVNYEPKTVVSFSQELGGGENNYPDTVKVVTEVPAESDAELKELTKLKFDIKSDDQNEVQVTPVLRAD